MAWPLSALIRSRGFNWSLGDLFVSSPARRTTTGNVTLSATADSRVQIITLDQDRDVTLPAAASGMVFIISNKSDSELDITLKNSSGTSLATIGQYQAAIAISDGTGWIIILGSAATLQT